MAKQEVVAKQWELSKAHVVTSEDGTVKIYLHGLATAERLAAAKREADWRASQVAR